VGAKKEELPALATTAFSLQRLMDLSPVRPTEADLLEILKASY
jgi:alcohol dehydrogenase class IV